MAGVASEGSRERGRPRSEKARRAILSATRTLMEEGGLTAVTMEGIAQRAGVGTNLGGEPQIEPGTVALGGGAAARRGRHAGRGHRHAHRCRAR